MTASGIVSLIDAIAYDDSSTLNSDMYRNILSANL